MHSVSVTAEPATITASILGSLMLRTSSILSLLALTVGCASTSALPTQEKVGGEGVENHSDQRLTDVAIRTRHEGEESSWLRLKTLEPNGFSFQWPRARELQQRAEVARVGGGGQRQMQTIDVGYRRSYRGNSVHYVFDGSTWKAEAVASTYQPREAR